MTLAPFSTTLKTPDRVTIREVTPSDVKLLQDGVEKLSDQSRTFRFLDAPDRIWVTGITYIKTHEGW